ncbi:hypothetical protein JR316_0003903 [Psilocybe cubensis]|uniref:AAA+ ATPase domain-containing protein n=2 Tax=Psilocybe cubensis TaxID=181762 RepID=A0A8H7Y181_PSICU|nr:hypothetical protein JR316_0003903 [Psilocybe cubensis]KAH9484421.1 hypothetical protein JR316_0003903 [Psilocybe cubensis]
MFAESCNFIHNASATINAEVLHSKDSSITPHIAAGPSTPHKSPEVIIESPRSIRSPPRSPRTTSLLLALRDVIGDPDEEEDELRTVVGNQAISAQGDNWSEALPTLVNIESGFGEFSQPENSNANHSDLDEPEDDDCEGHWTAISDYDDEDGDEANSASGENIFEDETVHNEPPDVITPGDDEPTVQLSAVGHTEAGTIRPLSSASSGSHRQSVASDISANLTASSLLSPIELADIKLKPIFPIERGHSSRGSNSFDSGYGENWKPPIPLQASPPRSPSVSSTFDLNLSPFGTRTSRLLSPRLGAFIARSPVSPAKTILSPAVQEEVEELDLSLDSPSTYQQQNDANFVTRSFSSEEIEGQDNTHSSAELMEILEGGETQDEQEDETSPDSYGHTSIWDPEGGPTAVYMGDPSVSQQSSEDDAEDDTAFLAYLNSPQLAQQPNENDTLGSFYDIYSGIAPDIANPSPSHSYVADAGRTTPQPEPASRSNSSTPASSLRERVFTPPAPMRKRSGTITAADSPNSLSSPITSLDSISRGRASPFSVSEHNSVARGTGSQSPFGQEVEVSKKVPFGFKNSFSLGRASRSSLMTSRSDRRSVPASPLQQYTPAPGQDSSLASTNQSPMTSRPGLKPLRLSTLLDSNHTSRSHLQSRMPATASATVTNFSRSGLSHRTSLSSASVSSSNSFSDNRLFSSARSSVILPKNRTSVTSSKSPIISPYIRSLADLEEPHSAPANSWRQSINYSRPSSRLSERFIEDDNEDDDTGHFSTNDPYGETIRRPIPAMPHTAPAFYPPTYAIETPKPTLMFAIASDNVDEVRHVLDSGEVDPNETVGPQSALMFALTNDKLSNKLEIVKTLLAYGADPATAKNVVMSHSRSSSFEGQEEEVQGEALPSPSSDPPKTLMDEIDPATRYYLERADAIHTRRISVLIKRSVFKPLTRVRYEIIGQDRALEQLFRVLSMHSKEVAVTPMVVMLCGPSGHGKSLLARKFGSLLDVPTHTVNMTTLRSTHDLWQSYSMSPYEEPTNCTLAEFLINNEGKRCVVVLDEIEKTVDQTALWSLLMPWELGRCSFEAGSRHVDVRNVIWLGTSNIGHDLVFQHREARKNPNEPMSREEYVELMALLRPRVSEKLGASVLSRITTVLPFVPFSLEEKRAICSEAFYTLGGEFARSLPQERVEKIISNALTSYIADEGARSLSRAISNQLVDII